MHFRGTSDEFETVHGDSISLQSEFLLPELRQDKMEQTKLDYSFLESAAAQKPECLQAEDETVPYHLFIVVLHRQVESHSSKTIC